MCRGDELTLIDGVMYTINYVRGERILIPVGSTVDDDMYDNYIDDLVYLEQYVIGKDNI